MIDEHGWTQRDPISEDELILLCVKNASLAQIENKYWPLIKKYEDKLK